MQPNLIKLYLMKRSVDSDVIMMAIRTMMTMITPVSYTHLTLPTKRIV